MFFIIVAIVFCVVLFGTLFILWAIHSSGVKAKCNEQESVNAIVKEQLSKKDFKTTKIFYLDDNATYEKEKQYKKFIAIDSISKKICLVDYQKQSMTIVDFNEILNYEIYENGVQETFGGKVGGFFSVFSAQTEGVCKDLNLIIRLNKFENSQINYEIVFKVGISGGLSKSSNKYRSCIRSLQEIVSFLEVVINENKKG